jgi:hypothetical protein
MRMRTPALLVAVLVLALSVVTVSALADLRSPEGTAELGASLAADPDVQDLLAEAVVEAIIDDVVQRSPIVVPLVALVRPLLIRTAEATIASPAGQEAVASALTDALRQLTTPGPLVIDLRPAALAAAEEAPAPLDTLARAAVERGVVGLIVLGDAAGKDPAEIGAPDPASVGRVAGLRGGVAVGLVLLLLVAAVVALLAPASASRRTVAITAGLAVLAVGTGSSVLLRAAPDAIVARIAAAPEVSGTAVADVLPVLVEGLSGLLTRTGTVCVGLALLGAAIVVVAFLLPSHAIRGDAAGPDRTEG